MITRPLRRQHICLSCQRSLARRSLSSYLSYASETTLSSKRPDDSALNEVHSQDDRSTDQRSLDTELRYNHPDDPQQKNTKKFDSFQEYSSGSSGSIGRSCSSPGPGPGTELRSQASPVSIPSDEGNLYGYTGPKQKKISEILNEKSLGGSSKVIVLRDSIFTFYRQKLDRASEKNPEHVDILGQLASERGLIDQEEVAANIEALRPKDGSRLQTWDDINVLVKEIQTGFTHSQLQGYIEGYVDKNDDKSPAEEWLANKRHAVILGIKPWMPGVSKVTDRFDDDPLRGYFMDSYTSKQNLILLLLRNCWKVELAEISDGIGQFELQIRKDDLDLMHKGAPSSLALLHGEFLAAADESLETIRSRGVIRITTLRHKTEMITQIIENVLQNIRRVEINLTDFMSPTLQSPGSKRPRKSVDNNFSNLDLSELGGLTNTDIIRLSDNKIRISCIEPQGNSGGLSPVDVAKRLLLTSSDTVNRGEHWLECDGVTEKPGLFVTYPQVEGLSWRDRSREWMRWKMPLSKTIEPNKEPNSYVETLKTSSTAEGSLGSESTDEIPQILPMIDEVEDNSGRSSVWNTTHFTESSALLGSVIHSPQNNGILHNPLDDNALTTFSTLVPNLTKVVAKSYLDAQAVKPQSSLADAPLVHITLRLLPNPFSASLYPNKPGKPKNGTIGLGAAILSALPPIEIRLAINSKTKTPALKEVLAIVQEKKVDRMLPGNGVDIRYQERVASRMRRCHSQSVHDFIENSRLDLLGGRMETPQFLTLPINALLCRGEGLSLLGPLKEGESDTQRSVEYIFAGLDIRHTLSLVYRGWRLLYTSIEAGRAGGKRGELKLRPVQYTRSGGWKVNKGKEFEDAVKMLTMEIGGGSALVGVQGEELLGRYASDNSAGRTVGIDSGATQRKFRILTQLSKQNQLGFAKTNDIQSQGYAEILDENEALWSD